MPITIRPISGDIVERNGAWHARVKAADGRTFMHPTRFPSRLTALDFVHLTVREGATLDEGSYA